MNYDLRNIIRQFNLLSCVHRYYISKASSNCGVYRGQPPIMDYLTEHGESTQRDIADALRISPASVAVSVKRMVKAGLLEKTADENDLRFNKIKMTPKGKAVNRACCEEFGSIDRQMFTGFSEEELGQFSEYLRRIYDNLSVDNVDPEEMHSILGRGIGKEDEEGGQDKKC